jgi:hypothetical protein
MATGNATYYFSEATGQTDLSAYPFEHPATSFANWDTLKRAATELAAPNLGLYSVSLDQAFEIHRIFKGATAPTSWNNHLQELRLEFATTEEILTAVEAIDVGGGGSSSSGGLISIPGVLYNAGYDPTKIVVIRGTTWSFTILKVTLNFPIDEMWFTLRKRSSDDEEESIAQISSLDGLLINNGAPATDSTLGSLTISGEVPEYEDTNVRNITIVVHSEATQHFPVTSSLIYDLKTKRSGSPIRNAVVHQSLKFEIIKDVTRRIS